MEDEKLQGCEVTGTGWYWLTSNVGPFCKRCFTEIKGLTDAEIKLTKEEAVH